jgi:curved DNA-binding protein CbpA
MSWRDRYCEILGVPTRAGIRQIKRAYRKLAKKYHPDICKAPDATERFVRIKEAYDQLLALERRRKYAKLRDRRVRTRQVVWPSPPRTVAEDQKPPDRGMPPEKIARLDRSWLYEPSRSGRLQPSGEGWSLGSDSVYYCLLIGLVVTFLLLGGFLLLDSRADDESAFAYSWEDEFTDESVEPCCCCLVFPAFLVFLGVLLGRQRG